MSKNPYHKKLTPSQKIVLYLIAGGIFFPLLVGCIIRPEKRPIVMVTSVFFASLAGGNIIQISR